MDSSQEGFDGFDGRALSQGEIDALLSKFSTEAEEPPAVENAEWKMVKAYDFRRPDKLSKDQMRTLQLLHETFARTASSSLTAFLRTAVQLNLVSIEQGLYGEYTERLPADTVLYILSMEPLEGTLLIGLDMVAATAAVDRLLGGAGVAPAIPRSPTEIELALIQSLISNMLKELKEAWGRVADLKPSIRDVVLDPRIVQVALRSDPVVVIAFEMSVLHCSGTVTLCLPYVILEPVLPKLTAQLWFAGSRRGGGTQRDQLRQGLDGVGVDVMVELGGAWVTLQELGNLREGDVILIDRATDRPVDVLVGGQPKFHARPGVIGNKLAVQVVARQEADLGAESGG